MEMESINRIDVINNVIHAMIVESNFEIDEIDFDDKKELSELVGKVKKAIRFGNFVYNQMELHINKVKTKI